MRYSQKLKEGLLSLIKDMRNNLSRRLQLFINTLLAPHHKVGPGKTEVLLTFNNPFLKDRKFVVGISKNDRSTFSRTSAKALHILESDVNTMSNTASSVMEFIESLEQIEFGDEEVVFLKPLMTEVLNAVKAVTNDARVRRKHRIESLQSVLKRVG